MTAEASGQGPSDGDTAAMADAVGRVGPLRIAMAADPITGLVGWMVTFLQTAEHEVTFVRKPAEDGHEPWQLWVPVAAAAVGRAVAAGQADVGVLMCTTGVGMTIAANKIPGVRAALCVDAATATWARRWQDANVCVLSHRQDTMATAAEILAAFLSTEPTIVSAATREQLAALEARRSVG